MPVMVTTLPETNISHPKVVEKMSFLVHWWDMLVPWKVSLHLEYIYIYLFILSHGHVKVDFVQFLQFSEQKTRCLPLELLTSLMINICCFICC